MEYYNHIKSIPFIKFFNCLNNYYDTCEYYDTSNIEELNKHKEEEIINNFKHILYGPLYSRRKSNLIANIFDKADKIKLRKLSLYLKEGDELVIPISNMNLTIHLSNYSKYRYITLPETKNGTELYFADFIRLNMSYMDIEYTILKDREYMKERILVCNSIIQDIDKVDIDNSDTEQVLKELDYYNDIISHKVLTIDRMSKQRNPNRITLCK